MYLSFFYISDFDKYMKLIRITPMVASIRNISAKSVIIGQAPPPPTPGIFLRAYSADMTYWSTYIADYPSITEITGTYDSVNLGTNGVLSMSDTKVNFSNTGSVPGTGFAFFANGSRAWEFYVDATYSVKLGYWAGEALNCDTFNPESSSGGGVGGFYYQNNGTIVGALNSTSGPTYTAGDTIGVVYDRPGGSDPDRVIFYKNGVEILSNLNASGGFNGYPLTGAY